MRKIAILLMGASALGLGACKDDDEMSAGLSGTGTSTAGLTTSGMGTGSGSGVEGVDSTGEIDETKLDVAHDTPPMEPEPEGCNMSGAGNVNPDPDAILPCASEAPPDSFDPVVEWTWDGRDFDYTPCCQLYGR